MYRFIKPFVFMVCIGLMVSLLMSFASSIKVPLLHQAALNGDMNSVRTILDQGEDVDIKEPLNYGTPLHWAVLNESIAVMELLLTKGANVNALDMQAATPLHYASTLGRVKAAHLLIVSGADILAKDRAGETPLHYAVTKDPLEPHKLQWFGRAPLQKFHLYETIQVNDQGKQELIEVLLEKGDTINIPDNHGYTPLYVAAKSGERDIVNKLLSKGAEMNVKGGSDWTPLHAAALYGHFDVVELLLAHGADVNAKTNEGETPLGAAMRSFSENKEKIIELLRQHGGIAIERECR